MEHSPGRVEVGRAPARRWPVGGRCRGGVRRVGRVAAAAALARLVAGARRDGSAVVGRGSRASRRCREPRRSPGAGQAARAAQRGAGRPPGPFPLGGWPEAARAALRPSPALVWRSAAVRDLWSRPLRPSLLASPALDCAAGSALRLGCGIGAGGALVPLGPRAEGVRHPLADGGFGSAPPKGRPLADRRGCLLRRCGSLGLCCRSGRSFGPWRSGQGEAKRSPRRSGRFGRAGPVACLRAGRECCQRVTVAAPARKK